MLLAASGAKLYFFVQLSCMVFFQYLKKKFCTPMAQKNFYETCLILRKSCFSMALQFSTEQHIFITLEYNILRRNKLEDLKITLFRIFKQNFLESFNQSNSFYISSRFLNQYWTPTYSFFYITQKVLV